MVGRRTDEADAWDSITCLGNICCHLNTYSTDPLTHMLGTYLSNSFVSKKHMAPLSVKELII